MNTAFDLLRNHIVGNGHRASRYARMNPPGAVDENGEPLGKYTTVHKPLSDAQIRAHILGTHTYAAILIGSEKDENDKPAGLVSAACIELDADALQGAGRVLRAAEKRGITAFSIAVKGAGNHDGSHTWILFSERVKPAHAARLARQIATDAGYSDAEIWPKGNAIRLPFGVHTHTGKRGTLLLQSGLVYYLDDGDLDAGAKVVAGLPLNEAPPEPPQVERKPIIKSNTMLPLTGPSPIAQFNRAHDLKAMMEAAGATLADAHNNLWHCGCGNHTSGNPSLQIVESDDPDRRGKYIAWSYSPNCTWAPLQDSGKYQDAYGFAGSPAFEKKASNNDYKIADPAIVEARRKDAQRKRDARRQAAAELRAEVESRAAADPDLTPCDHAVLDALLTIAGDRGWARPSKERLAEMSGYSLGSVKRALMRMEDHYFTSEGDGGGPNCTAVRTFLRGSFFATENTSDVKYDPRIVISSRDLDQSSDTCERAAAPDSLDTWEWQADEHGADELNAMEAIVTEIRNSGFTTQPADRMAQSGVNWALVEQIGTWTDDELRAWMAGQGTFVNQLTEVTSEKRFSEAEPDTPGASYVGTPLITHDPHAVPSWLRLTGDIGPMARKVEEEPTGNTPLPVDLFDPDPEIRCPPADPKKRDRYYGLLGKARKATSPGQRIALEREAAKLEEWRPLSEVRAGSQAPPTFRLPPAAIGALHGSA